LYFEFSLGVYEFYYVTKKVVGVSLCTFFRA
jgi:hypothetical protein